MNRYKVIDLLSKKQEEIKRITRGVKNGKLYCGVELICENKDISKFYLSVLSHLAYDKNVDIKQGLDTTYNEDGKQINDGSAMRKVPNTEIWVDTKSNNDTKYKKMLKCFELLMQKENINLYEFELDTICTDEKENEGENDMNVKDVNGIISEAISKNKQVIFTGAPGTGKTWSVREYVKHQCAILDSDGNEQYDIKEETIVEKNGNEQKIRKQELKVHKGQYKFVQFHPSYDYSDFVEGLRPVVLKENKNTEPTFVRMDGVFKEFCRHIVEQNEKDKKYYFIVDEINRADLAKVFGELMFGLEESYRGKDNPIQTQYKNLVTYRIITEEDDADKGKAIAIENDVFKDGFYIPENLYFIGTMNDIDRSVDSMDFALRRRFQWIDVKANEIMKSSLHSIIDKENKDANSENYKKIDNLAAQIINMNNIISNNNKFGLSEAYHIGPAYFKKLNINDDGSLKDIFETNVVSILKEYTRGRKNEEVINWINQCGKALLGDDYSYGK